MDLSLLLVLVDSSHQVPAKKQCKDILIERIQTWMFFLHDIYMYFIKQPENCACKDLWFLSSTLVVLSWLAGVSNNKGTNDAWISTRKDFNLFTWSYFWYEYTHLYEISILNICCISYQKLRARWKNSQQIFWKLMFFSFKNLIYKKKKKLKFWNWIIEH